MAAFSYGLTNPCSLKLSQTPVDNSFYYMIRQNYGETSKYLICKSTKDITNTSNWKQITIPNGVTGDTVLKGLVIGKDKIIIYTTASTSSFEYYYLSNINTGWVKKTLSVGSSSGVSKMTYSPELDLYVVGNSNGTWTSSNSVSFSKSNSNSTKNVTWCHDRFISSDNKYSTNGTSWSNLPSSSYKPTVAILGAFNINGTWKTYGVGRNTSSPYLAYLVSYTNGSSSGFAYDKSATVPALGPYLTIRTIEINPEVGYLACYNTDSSYNTPRRYDLIAKSQTNWSNFHSSYNYEYVLADDEFLWMLQYLNNSSNHNNVMKKVNSSFGINSYNNIPPFTLSRYTNYFSSLYNQNYMFFKVPTSVMKSIGIE